MIYVIADDITGAAEIAGIAKRYGLKTNLQITDPSKPPLDGEEVDVCVIATDARSYPATKAAELTAQAVMKISSLLGRERGRLFRKTDSALRGNVREELQAILDNTLYTDVLYMPANPSKGRIIRDGVYYINGTPLSETDFRFDPEFPAFSSRLEDRFHGLPYANAETKADVDAVVEDALKYNKLLAGAADLFCSFIEHIYHKQPNIQQTPSLRGRAGVGLLIVRGSTQSKSIDLGLPVETMPDDVFTEKAAPSVWAEVILPRYLKTYSSLSERTDGESGVILAINGSEGREGARVGDPVYLRNAMAEVCCRLIAAHEPDELIIEGGATAYAILSQLPWTSFAITDEIAPGVVRLQPENSNIHITLKPGSYDWGNLWK